MKKLRLDVDALRVESFDPVSAETRRAGVHAHMTLPTECSCLINSCGGESYCYCTGYDGCSQQGTCAQSCRSEPCVCVPQG